MRVAVVPFLPELFNHGLLHLVAGDDRHPAADDVAEVSGHVGLHSTQGDKGKAIVYCDI